MKKLGDPFYRCNLRHHESENDIFSRALGGKSRATLGAAALQNFATRGSGITLHETMLNFALTLVRLVGAFCSHNISLKKIKNLCLV